MIKLEQSQVFLKQAAKNKHDALEIAGHKMIEAGLVSEEYIPGIHARESIASTFLDHGIAIPHGMPESRFAIQRTGVVVIQFPDGVDWENNQKVFLAFAIAAHCDEHLKILSDLTRILDNPSLCRLLSKTSCPDVILDALEGKPKYNLSSKKPVTRKINSRGWATAPSPDPHMTFEFTLTNDNGFHARCCSAFISTIDSLDAKVDVRNASKSSVFVNGRSLVKLLSLEVLSGERLEVRIYGAISRAVLSKLEALFSQGISEP